MSAFEITVLVIVFVGVVLPVWAAFLIIWIVAKKNRVSKPSAKYLAYSELVRSVYEQAKSGKFDHGAIYVAAVRELQEYPEYADLSLFFLEELSVDGDSKFDRILKTEIKFVESRLLEMTNG